MKDVPEHCLYLFSFLVGTETVQVFSYDSEKFYPSGEFCFGEYVAKKQHIYIERSLDKYQFYVTLLHELIHAISDINGLFLVERTVRILEQGLGLLFLRNPDLCRTIVSELTNGKEDERG